jgi:DNA-binding MarR family transcriptional regulator
MATESLLQMIYAAHMALSRLEQEPRAYGTGRLFYASEIHTLACIGENPYINLTSLAMKLEVSKSAASKFVKKLMDAACIEKTKSPDNEKDVLFHATGKGKRAIQGHRAFRATTFGPLEGIEARLDPAARGVISSFLADLNAELKKGAERS